MGSDILNSPNWFSTVASSAVLILLLPFRLTPYRQTSHRLFRRGDEIGFASRWIKISSLIQRVLFQTKSRLVLLNLLDIFLEPYGVLAFQLGLLIIRR